MRVTTFFILITGALLLSSLGNGSGIQSTAFAQSRIPPVVAPKVPPQLPSPSLNLPPAPTVMDWQPRGRAVAGGTIVITGQGFRPQEFEAVIGSQKFRLPVRTASSSSTRIELDVPSEALGLAGSLVVGHHLTQSRTLEASYRIEAPSPSIASVTAGPSVFPFMLKSLNVKVRDFPGARLEPGNVTVGGTCRFVKRSNVSYQARDRAADLSLEFFLLGWFETSGNCQIEFNLTPLSADGSRMATVHLEAPFSVSTPVQYSFADTAVLKERLQPSLSHFGVGSFCNGTPPLGGPVGIVDFGGDFSILTRGGPLDVSCTFRTKEWILPEGVRLKEIRWGTTSQGNRCGNAGTFSHTFPALDLPLTRGAVVVRPNADQPEADFFAFSDRELVVDGVSYASNLTGPRTMIKPFVLGTQCVSTLTVLVTATGTFGPTVDPQSFRIVLEKLVLEGPPNLMLP